ncbi:tail fiber assembly protein [Plesiomonas shigelloides]|uniref:tail fiber assembly protein n=1 Tax=Plesiomonas shigelloides TaxID=703 RepID=UPI001784D67C|nr:tail fiber assembly protein [Plesiomonas shigelloides]MDT1012384.1 tail fiber assembly protein [Plesiomonas shigelloides]QOH78369.1 tail fiber assembly protein [Plesiomonas shigelloides]
MVIFFSATTCCFYLLDMKPDYIAAGSWPDDAVEMTDKEKETYWTKQAPFGKQLGGDNKGHPAWINTQPLSHEEAVAEAEAKKSRLLSEAAEKIGPLQDAVDLDMATPEEEAMLKEWKNYRVMTNRVDTSLGADAVWPGRVKENIQD